MRDEIFKNWDKGAFEFDAAVASVFDDMVGRSVPYYAASQQLSCELLARRLKRGGVCVDIGCSTGAFLLRLHSLRADLRLIGVDNSPAMIEVAHNRAKAFGAPLELICGDALNGDILPHFEADGLEADNTDAGNLNAGRLGVNHPVTGQKAAQPCGKDGQSCDKEPYNKKPCAHAAILNYTLQFIAPDKRPGFLELLRGRLHSGDMLILSEKLCFDDAQMQDDLTAIYEDYKARQGYSQTEIAAKRRALETVLIPFSEAQNKNMLKNAGFGRIQTLFLWGNFASFIAFAD